MRWTLVNDWQRLLRKAWSVRLALLSALLSAIEFGVQYLAPEKSSGAFALVAMFVSLGASVARIVAQPKLWSTDDFPSTQQLDKPGP